MEIIEQQTMPEYLPGSFGDAFDTVYYLPNGAIWVTNGEYGQYVAFCPVTGRKAEIVPETHD